MRPQRRHVLSQPLLLLVPFSLLLTAVFSLFSVLVAYGHAPSGSPSASLAAQIDPRAPVWARGVRQFALAFFFKRVALL
jgi:hypothetical protein